MATFKFIFWKYKPDKNGKSPIYLRIIENRKAQYISTELKTTKKFWNENRGRFRKNHPNALAYNDYLDRMRHEAQNKYLKLKRNDKTKISSDKIKDLIAGKESKIDFFAYAQKHTYRLFDRDQYNTWKKYRSVVKKISEFVEGKTLHFEEITPDFLDTLETWLQTERNNNKNTIYKDMSVFRRIIRQAVKDKIIPLEGNPFLQYSLSKQKINKENYLFPLLSSGIEYRSDRVLKQKISSCNALVNKNLKKLMKITGVKTNISFHIARHSFADYARRQGMDLYAISKALGHQSLSITEQYLKSFDQETIDSAMDELFRNKQKIG